MVRATMTTGIKSSIFLLEGWRTALALLGLTVLSATACMSAQGPPLARAGELPERQRQFFDTRHDPAFGDAAIPLARYLDEQETKTRGPQHFCVVGYLYPSGSKAAQVHWREGGKLILWEGASAPEYVAGSIARSRRDLDLENNVVATEADVNGSTYLVTRA